MRRLDIERLDMKRLSYAKQIVLQDICFRQF